MRYKFFFTIYLTLLWTKSFGQTIITKNSDGNYTTSFQSFKASTANTSNINNIYLGSPFFGGTEWHLAKIRLDNDYEISVTVAYNLIEGNLYLLDTTEKIIKKIIPKSFVLDGSEFVCLKKYFSGISSDSFGQILYAGKTKLVLRLERIFIGVRENGYDGYYKDINQYYIQKEGVKLQRISLTPSSILKKLSAKQTEVNTFLLKNKLTFKNHDDLISILKFYDSL